MHSLWIVQWNSTKRDHPGNTGRVSGSGLVTVGLIVEVFICSNKKTKPLC